MPIVRKSVYVITEELVAQPIAPSRIRCRGLTFSPGVRVWVKAVTSSGKRAKALPRVRIDGGPLDAGTASLVDDFESTPFPDGIKWQELPPMAIEAFASMRAMNDHGYDGYCEFMAGVQMASVARLHFTRKRGDRVQIRLHIGRKTFELLVPLSDLEPFLLEEPLSSPAQVEP